MKKEKADGDDRKKDKKRKKSESPGGTRKRKSKWGPDTVSPPYKKEPRLSPGWLLNVRNAGWSIWASTCSRG